MENPTGRRLKFRLREAFCRTFDLGFTSFGGPPVHFQVFQSRFVDDAGRKPWIDEQTSQELFAVSQALPGPASTKMLFSITQIHSGLIAAVMVFLLWSLPSSIAMYGLSLGVSRIGETLPDPVYALLSGLNSATVGLIALAAIRLARKAITDRLTRFLVAFGACAGMLHKALWYLPVLLVAAGISTVAWDIIIQPRLVRRPQINEPESSPAPTIRVRLQDLKFEEDDLEKAMRLRNASIPSIPPMTTEVIPVEQSPGPSSPQPTVVEVYEYRLPVKVGVAVILSFFATFAVFMTVRGTVLDSHRAAHNTSTFLLDLFSNMFLAGTIIFGGGPVVVPLLRDYVVDPGWVSPRDFLLGLAVIQALPGPNFSFAVYLGAVAAGNMTNLPTIVGAILAFVGIFTPGLWLCVGCQSVWQYLRQRREVSSMLRGVNAAAVGFVFTAVYRLWEIGYLTASDSKGVSLGREPWWLVVSASTFTAVEWFSVPPPVAILTGGVAGLAWWGVVSRH